jgi:ATP-dependent RNA helicase RhlE
VNFELPNVAEDYVHRIGRTGRAGLTGAAVSLVDSEEIGLLRAIEKLINKPIERIVVAGFDTSKSSANAAEADEDRQPRTFRQPRQQRGRQPDRRPDRKPDQPSDRQPNWQPDRQRRGPHAKEAPRQHQHSAPWRDEPQRQPKPAAVAEGTSGEEMSEAARHQAMAQPALFAPPSAPRRRTWGKTR